MLARTIAALVIAGVLGALGAAPASATGVVYKRPGATQPIVTVLPNDPCYPAIGTYTGTTGGRWTPVN